MLLLGRDEQGAEFVACRQRQGAGSAGDAQPALLVGQAEQQRLRGVHGADDATDDRVRGGLGPDLPPRPAVWPIAVLTVLDDHALDARLDVVVHPGPSTVEL